MKYLKVRWTHDHPGEPIELYSEIDEAGWEVRKVEVFVDGSVGYAGPGEATNSTRLSEKPLPSIEEIAADLQFEPTLIGKEDFESVWRKRMNPKLVKS